MLQFGRCLGSTQGRAVTLGGILTGSLYHPYANLTGAVREELEGHGNLLLPRRQIVAFNARKSDFLRNLHFIFMSLLINSHQADQFPMDSKQGYTVQADPDPDSASRQVP
jgi:hypothetical protein